MDLGLKDKVAIVLASTSGLGFASAEALLAEGARVAISGRDTGRLEKAVEDLRRKARGRVHGDACDVKNADELAGHIDRVRKKWGAIHILVTNAGGPPPRLPSEVTEADLDLAFNVTLKSAVNAINMVLPEMRRQKWGRIIGLTSLSVRQPTPDLALSSTIRAGLTGYLKSLAAEVAKDGVLVNSVCTGLFATERLFELIKERAKRSRLPISTVRDQTIAEVPMARLGNPTEFGAIVAFLASERASYLSGVALPLDGGFSRAIV